MNDTAKLLVKASMGLCHLPLRLDSLLLVVPIYRWPRDAVLDTLLGPAEPFEYVSTTAPEAPR